MGGFNHPDTCWKDNTTGLKQCRRFLVCIDDNFLAQVIKEPRKGALLDLIPINQLVTDVTVGGTLGYSDHEMVKFGILGGSSTGGSVEEETINVSSVEEETTINIMFLLMKKYRA